MYEIMNIKKGFLTIFLIMFIFSTTFVNVNAKPKTFTVCNYTPEHTETYNVVENQTYFFMYNVNWLGSNETTGIFQLQQKSNDTSFSLISIYEEPLKNSSIIKYIPSNTQVVYIHFSVNFNQTHNNTCVEITYDIADLTKLRNDQGKAIFYLGFLPIISGIIIFIFYLIKKRT